MLWKHKCDVKVWASSRECVTIEDLSLLIDAFSVFETFSIQLDQIELVFRVLRKAWGHEDSIAQCFHVLLLVIQDLRGQIICWNVVSVLQSISVSTKDHFYLLKWVWRITLILILFLFCWNSARLLQTLDFLLLWVNVSRCVLRLGIWVFLGQFCCIFFHFMLFGNRYAYSRLLFQKLLEGFVICILHLRWNSHRNISLLLRSFLPGRYWLGLRLCNISLVVLFNYIHLPSL